MTSRYLCLEDILAEDERVPAQFVVAASRVGHLDPSGSGGGLARGSRVDLPLWLAESLAAANHVVVEIPRAWGARAREALAAAPVTDRLRDRSPSFYEVGLRLAALSRLAEAGQLPDVIQAVLATRVAMILDRAAASGAGAAGGTAGAGDASAFLDPLTNLERALFWGGYRHARDRMAWMQRHTDALRAGFSSGAAAGSGGANYTAGVADARSVMGGAYKRSRAALT